jgi:cytochrome c oxidase cbb3-type subunit I/II
MRTLGVPYEAGFEEIAEADLLKQAEKIASNLTKEGYPVEPQKEIVAMIAYLQRLGTDIKLSNTTSK